MKYKKEMKLKGVEVEIFLLLNDYHIFASQHFSNTNTNITSTVQTVFKHNLINTFQKVFNTILPKLVQGGHSPTATSGETLLLSDSGEV